MLAFSLLTLASTTDDFKEADVFEGVEATGLILAFLYNCSSAKQRPRRARNTNVLLMVEDV